MIDGDDFLRFLLGIVLIITMMFLSPWIEMMLWNWVVVDLFAGPTISFWQMFGLNWLCGLLFHRSNSSITAKRDE